jgi:hypothetical protein
MPKIMPAEIPDPGALQRLVPSFRACLGYRLAVVPPGQLQRSVMPRLFFDDTVCFEVAGNPANQTQWNQ